MVSFEVLSFKEVKFITKLNNYRLQRLQDPPIYHRICIWKFRRPVFTFILIEREREREPYDINVGVTSLYYKISKFLEGGPFDLSWRYADVYILIKHTTLTCIFDMYLNEFFGIQHTIS